MKKKAKDNLTEMLDINVGSITEELTAIITDPPKMIGVGARIEGTSAGRVALAIKLITASLNLSEEQAVAYLITAGAEREIAKLANLWNSVHEERIEI